MQPLDIICNGICMLTPFI